jgi:hypothetical protein
LNIKDGKLYGLRVHVTQDYYDSYPEIDEVEFVEVKEG